MLLKIADSNSSENMYQISKNILTRKPASFNTAEEGYTA
jgi:hypothetical protein